MGSPHRGKRERPRVLVAYDGESWYVRRVKLVEHDLEADEMIYYCDQPIGVRFDSPRKALTAALAFLRPNTRGER